MLARTPDAPPGTKGISCFIVPKFLVNDDGSLGERNDVKCVSIEHKMGIHASPTCVLSFGDAGEGAVGYLIGEENQGMRYMFTMMNNARLSVGLEGLAVAERAYQDAVAYAQERRQGRPSARRRARRRRSSSTPTCADAADDEGARSRPCAAWCYIDRRGHRRRHPPPRPEASREPRQRAASTCSPRSPRRGAPTSASRSPRSASRCYGGMGYIEETGVAQHYRDARITPIYEGTNGIQAIDLVGRKLPDARRRRRDGPARHDRHAGPCALPGRRRARAHPHEPRRGADDPGRHHQLDRRATASRTPTTPSLGATPYLRMFGLTRRMAHGPAALAASGPPRGRHRRRRAHAGEDRHRPLLRRAAPPRGQGPRGPGRRAGTTRSSRSRPSTWPTEPTATWRPERHRTRVRRASLDPCRRQPNVVHVFATSLASIPSPPSNAIGPFRAYGLMIALGVIAAVELARRRWRRRGGDPDDITAIAMWAVPAGLVGARLYHVITDWQPFPRTSPVEASARSGTAASASPAGSSLGVIVGVLVARHRKGMRRRVGHRRRHPRRRRWPRPSVGSATGSTRSSSAGRPTCPGALEIDPAHRPVGYVSVRHLPPDVPLRGAVEPGARRRADLARQAEGPAARPPLRRSTSAATRSAACGSRRCASTPPT